MKRSGFTMIELIFVIVILGILAAVAIPKLAATRDDAKIAKIASDGTTFVSDVGSYYTSKGTFASPAKLSDVSNVAFGTTSSPTATSTTFMNATLNLTDGTNTCATFTPGEGNTTDGGLTVAAGSNTGSICTAVKAALVKANLLNGTASAPTTKYITFGGTGVVQ